MSDLNLYDKPAKYNFIPANFEKPSAEKRCLYYFGQCSLRHGGCPHQGNDRTDCKLAEYYDQLQNDGE